MLMDSPESVSHVWDCQACGACCAFAGNITTFLGQSAASRIPDAVRAKITLFNQGLAGDICVALEGTIGSPCGCSIYADRPADCRTFAAGSEPCLETRRIAGL
jgi:Fe-S-cluster containining protein